MQRWFFANEPVVCKKLTPVPSPSKSVTTSSTTSLPDINWKFNVKFQEKLCSNETLSVCGSCHVLGHWDVQRCLPLSKVKDTSYWTLTIGLPHVNEIRYRYLICATNIYGRRFVRFWEAHLEGRLIRHNLEQNINSSDDTFGVLYNKCKIERGWITPDITVVQFKFFHGPFILKGVNSNPLMYVKVTPIKVIPEEECGNANKLIHMSEDLRSTFAFSEVVSLQNQNGEFHCPPKYGTPCGTTEMLMFNLTLGDVEHTAYLIDLYNYPVKTGADIPPYHFGYQYVLPQQLQGSEGTLNLSVMCATKHRSIGSMKCDYLVIKSIPSHDFNMEETFQRHWNTKDECFDIGHRGCGNSFRFQNNILRENTIKSFDLAFEHGAKMVEFDIQLTKDLVPVLYHDFQLYISKKFDIDPETYDVMHLPLDDDEINFLKPFGKVTKSGLISFPLNKFTLNQLNRISFYEIPKESKSQEDPYFVECENNQPFQTLQHVLEKVSSKLGFIIDIKWPQRFTDDTMQEYFTQDIDRNVYVDIILDLVLRKADLRHIIFSSLDADICTMLRLKQNRYPVLFSIHPQICGKNYMDPRGDYMHTGSRFARAMELLGIIVNSANFMEMQGKLADIHKHDLCVFCWDGDTRIESTRKYLKALGANGIIFDRVNQVLDPEDLKRNIYFIELLKNNF